MECSPFRADKVDGATGARITKIESDVADMKHTMGNLDRTVKVRMRVE